MVSFPRRQERKDLIYLSEAAEQGENSWGDEETEKELVACLKNLNKDKVHYKINVHAY